jgi:hypothetical protein
VDFDFSLLSKTSPGTYRSYRMNSLLALLVYACVACALCVGSYLMVIGCIIVPSHIIFIVDVLPLYD